MPTLLCRIFIPIGVILVSLIAFVPRAAAGPVVNPGPANFAQTMLGTRLKNFKGAADSLYVGVPDLGIGACRVIGGLRWENGRNSFSLTLDRAADSWRGNASNGNGTANANMANVSNPLPPPCVTPVLDSLGAMQIMIRNDLTDATVELKNVMLDANPLGDFTLTKTSSGPNLAYWNVTGYPFHNGFTLTGDLVLTPPAGTGNFNNCGNEACKLELSFGSITPTAVDVFGVEAQRVKKNVRVQWETGSELNLLGFNILRSSRKSGPFAQLNAEMLAAQCPGCVTGARYEYVDTTAKRKQVYFYKLQAVKADGTIQEFGPVRVR